MLVYCINCICSSLAVSWPVYVILISEPFRYNTKGSNYDEIIGDQIIKTELGESGFTGILLIE